MNERDIAGIAALTAYFADPSHHRDGDPKHVSVDELRAAYGAVSAEADQVIDELLINRSAYDALANVEREGLFNDLYERHDGGDPIPLVSMRDLYAMARGTSYSGANNSRQRETVFTRLREASVTLAAVQARFAAPATGEQQRANLGGVTYTIEAGRVYGHDERTGVVSEVPDSVDVKAILAHRGELVALTKENRAFVYTARYSDPGIPPEWIVIGRGVKQLCSNGDDLLAVDGDGVVSKYRGKPGGVVKGYRYGAFDDTELRNVSSIANDSSGQIVLTFANGRTAIYGQH